MNTDLWRHAAEPSTEGNAASAETVSEVQIYLQLMVTAFLIDGKRPAEAADLSSAAVDLVSHTRRRISNDLAAKAFFFYSWAHELIGKSASIRCVWLL